MNFFKNITLKDIVIIGLLIYVLILSMQSQKSIEANTASIDKQIQESKFRYDSITILQNVNSEKIDKLSTTVTKSSNTIKLIEKNLNNEKQELSSASDSVNIAWFHTYIEQYRNSTGFNSNQ